MKTRFLFLFVLFSFNSFSQEKELPYYIEKAKHNSPLITDYSNQITAVKMDSLLLLATYKPQVAVNVNANYAPVINGYGYDTVLTNGQILSGLIGFNQKIWGNNLKVQTNSYRQIREAIVINEKIAVKDLTKAITLQYITAWGIARQIEFNQKTIKLLNDQDLILKKLTQHSVYKQTDYLILNATEKEQELNTLQLKQQYKNEVALLNYLSGESENSQVVLKSPELLLAARQSKKSIFLRQFETDSLKVLNGNKILDAAYKPTLSLLGDAGYHSSLNYQAHKNLGVSIGFGFTVPIYDGNQRNLQYQKSKVVMETMTAYKTNFKRQYAQQIYMFNLKLDQTKETAIFLKSQLIIAEALIDANKKLLLTGDAQISEYILALRNLVAIQNGMAQNEVVTQQIINELNYWTSNE